MSQLFADDFNTGSEPNATNWTESVGSWNLTGQRLRSTGMGLAICQTTSSAHAAEANAKVTITQRTTTGDGGPVARCTEADATPTLYMCDVWSNKCEIIRHNNSGTGTVLRTVDITRVADAVAKLEVSGTGSTVTLRQYYNGVQQGADYLDGDASRITSAGRTGVLVWIGQADGGDRGDYDNFLVEDNAASAALTGTATASIDESDIVDGGKTIILTLTNDTYVAANTYGTPTWSTGATKGTTAADTANP